MAHQGVELEMDALKLPAGSWMVGKTLEDVSLPARAGAMVTAMRRSDGKPVYNPGPDLMLQAGDTLILIGKRGVASLIEKLDGPGRVDSKVGST